jgi:hypothetical protein
MKIELSDAEDVRVFLEMCGVVPADEDGPDDDICDDTMYDDPCEGCEKVSPSENRLGEGRNLFAAKIAELTERNADLITQVNRADDVGQRLASEKATLERENFELRDLCRVISQRTHSDRVVSQMLADKREVWDRIEKGKEGATMDAGKTPATPAGDTQLAGGGPIETQVTHVTMGKFTGELMVSQDGGETWENRGREPIAIVMKRPSDQPYVDLRERLEDTESRLAEALRDCGDLEVSLSNEMARGQTLAQAVRDVMGLNQEPPVYGELSTAWAEYHG